MARRAPLTVRLASNLAGLLPFADAASPSLPLSRILRLSLFQLSVGMASVLLTGTLNRVLIVELNVKASLVALMVALPMLSAPFRALIGFKSDTHRSFLGWRRGPYIWFGSLLQFGGLSFMPFALLVMSGYGQAPAIVGEVAATFAFLMVGAGIHTTQTAGLALANDLASEEARPRVVALLYVMLLVGMLVSALVIGRLLADFSPLRLIQVVQGAAALTLILNVAALWKQEVRDTTLTSHERERPTFEASWRDFIRVPGAMRLLLAVGVGSAAFSMQDVLLEPFGGQVLHLRVGATTSLTAIWSIGALGGFALAARVLQKGLDPHRLAGLGAVAGLPAFALVILSAPLQSILLFKLGVVGIGFGSGLFAVGALTAAMAMASRSTAGLALGAWGAVQASGVGLATLAGGAIRDGVGMLAAQGMLGEAGRSAATGYVAVYALEILLIFATLAAIGPLARHATEAPAAKFGLAEFPTS